MEVEKEPLVITDKNEMRQWSRTMRAQGKTIGLVPTMGYLHEGHLSLIRESHTHTHLTVVSIYVNPGQFSPSEDLSTYPSDFKGDIDKLKSVPGGVDVVFHPYNLYDYGGGGVEREVRREKEVGGAVVSCVEERGVGHETWVRVEKLEKGMCGKSRPVFFRGVATVVAKLFNVVEPDVAFFGKKDYQQWRIIRRMVRDLDFSIEVIGSEIVRDDDGLAMSSRNVHLSPEEREKALSINRSLSKAKLAAEKGQVNCRELKDSVFQAVLEAGGRIDYAEIVDQESLEAVEVIKGPVVFCVAAWFGKVRLIDNKEIYPKFLRTCPETDGGVKMAVKQLFRKPSSRKATRGDTVVDGDGREKPGSHIPNPHRRHTLASSQDPSPNLLSHRLLRARPGVSIFFDLHCRSRWSSCQSLRVVRFSSGNACKFSSLCMVFPKVNPCAKDGSMRCYCLGTLINTNGATFSEWVPVVDQVLLMASIFLTYMAGVIPAQKLLSSSRKRISLDDTLSGDALLSGRAAENDNEEANLKLPWEIVEEKLMDTLNAVEQRHKMGTGFKFEQDLSKRPLSLYAVDEGPRFRLLWASFQWLKKEAGTVYTLLKFQLHFFYMIDLEESRYTLLKGLYCMNESLNKVDNVSAMSASVSRNDWSTVLSEVLQKSCQPVCVAWLEQELCLKSSIPDMELLSTIVEKLTGEATILQNVINSGKEDLYSELAQFLIFGSLREGCCYDCSLFTQYGVDILEDLVITLADAIASLYLELISVDGNMSNEINSIGLMMCTLSTRELQKLRNEVALNQWLHQNMEAVVSMYEDRFDLRTLQSQLIEGPSKTNTDNFSWWKRLTLRKSESVASPLHYVVINDISITVKRTKELRALTGWRYYYSLFLELADITMPVIRTVFKKVSDAISFFLVCLIGRSLGLIYTGIRQSLRWK
ncbi:hypothetical protein RHGRI_035944 [Rhododendron griersonianum]|uniref:Pantoate--beta-alanine ligase n=1 Tax=Rhododendron griersonianum TaxID=479676 RepID=A0AAV6HP26_9ERIC|nr:hypothetical protein RHGRI_035944 [Rhododendron griersonianum]